MSGADFLVDSNVLIDLLNGKPSALEVLLAVQANPSRCAYSSITRIEFLGWSGMTPAQDIIAQSLLAAMQYLPINQQIENATIALRRGRKIKLPDAFIAATAHVYGLQLLTLDQGLQGVMVVFE